MKGPAEPSSFLQGTEEWRNEKGCGVCVCLGLARPGAWACVRSCIEGSAEAVGECDVAAAVLTALDTEQPGPHAGELPNLCT